MWLRHLLILILLFPAIAPPPAYAYLDPGSGSFILQMIIAGFVTSMFVIKMYWEKTKNFMKKLFFKQNVEKE